MAWQQVAPIRELGSLCFEHANFVVAVRRCDAYFIWSLYRRHRDGSLETLNGIWSQFRDTPDLEDGLAWADSSIADGA